MNSLKILTKLLPILMLIVSAFSSSAQDKIITERDYSIRFSGEVMDIMYSNLDLYKVPLRAHLGIEKKLNKKNKGIGLSAMFSQVRTIPWSLNSGTEIFGPSEELRMIQYGKTIGMGVEFYFKKFRNKKSALYPIGSYFDYGLGFHHTIFTGYKYDIVDPEHSTNIITSVRDPKRSITSISLFARVGKQWVFDNNVFWSYGLGVRGHVPISNILVQEDEATEGIMNLYFQELLFTDWFSTHLSLGYIF